MNRIVHLYVFLGVKYANRESTFVSFAFPKLGHRGLDGVGLAECIVVDSSTARR